MGGSAGGGSRQSAGQGPVGVGDLSGAHVQGDLTCTQVADASDNGLVERNVVVGVVWESSGGTAAAMPGTATAVTATAPAAAPPINLRLDSPDM